MIGLLRDLLSSDGGKDLTYEERVKQDCDHEWGPPTPDDDHDPVPVLDHEAVWFAPTLSNGFLVVRVVQQHHRYCELCGEENPIPEVHAVEKVAFQPAVSLDPDVTLAEAGYEAVEEENDGEGRIVVNRSENPVDA